jgi:hydrogenase nickel incorporation protein HypA/HybF
MTRTVHEFPVSTSIMSIVLEHAEAAAASKVKGIRLTVGQLTGFVPECIELQIRILSKGTIAEGVALSFNRPPANLHCRFCRADYSPDDLNLLCPNCGKMEFDVLSGRECLVDNIEVE